MKSPLFFTFLVLSLWIGNEKAEAEDWNFGMIVEHGERDAAIGLALGYQFAEFAAVKAESLVGLHGAHQAYSSNRIGLQHAYVFNETIAPYVSYGAGYRNYFGSEWFVASGIRLTYSSLYYEAEVTRNCLEKNYGGNGCSYQYRPLVIGFRF